MIPIQLTIQGLYSYQKKQTIDFTKLTASHLFGIFGSVGSGKSSILEAITFALYGETDRLNSRDSRNYNMMNLKSNELLIDFIFETGKDQTAYRAMVSSKRNSKQFEDVKKLDRTTYIKIDEKWLPIESSELENAIGLSYENFKRTIIIPQGQFQEFLQLGNTDRTKMMKELFNLEKFELYYKTTALESKNNELKQNIQGQLQQLGEIDPNQITAFQEQLVHLEKELTDWSEKLKSLQEEEKHWQQIKELAEKLNNSKSILEKLQKEQPEFNALEKSIQQYEKCVATFKSILDALETSNKKISLKNAQVQADTQKLEKEESEIKTTETQLIEIKPAFDNREKLKQRADELEKVSKIKELNKTLEIEIERLKNGNKYLTDTTDKVNKLIVINENLKKEIKVEKLKIPDLSLLANIKTWFVEKTNFDDKQVEINEEIRKQQTEEKTINSEILQILNISGLENYQEKPSVHEALLNFTEKTETIKNKIKLLENEADHLRVKAQLEKYAGDLTDGKPCPLCGSTHHPEKYNAENIREEQIQIEAGIQAFETEIEKITETVTKIREKDSKLQFAKKTMESWNAKLDELNKKISKHIYHQNWPVFENREKVENIFETAKNLQEEIKKKEDELEKSMKLLESENKDKERFQLAIEKIKTGITVFETESITLINQLKIVSPDDFTTKSIDEIEAEKKALLQQLIMLEKQFNELTSQLAKLQETKNVLSGSLSANKLELTLEQKTNSDLVLQLESELQQSEYSAIEEVKLILSQPIDLALKKQQLADFKQNFALASVRFEELRKEMGSRVYDSEAHQKKINEIKTTKETVTQKNQEVGKVNELLKALQKKLINQAELRKTHDGLELRAENIKTLKALFKASGFVNYISSVYLQNLCNAANDRFFKLTRQKLSLEITEDNNFQVRDFMNGGKVRNVKTLSGGQTFQAALSLALALADNIQKITESNQNFFFLDEGFGSLDKESLTIVFDTLKSLRNENRIVGVISHVEEMQQEIDVHLRIENNDESGSLIYESWAG